MKLRAKLRLRSSTSSIGVALVLAAAIILLIPAANTRAAAQLVQAATPGTTNGGTTVSATFTTGATANNLLVAICGAHDSVTFTTPSGFSVAKSESGTPSQVIYYKVATGGETTVTCTVSASARIGLQLYEYSNIVTASPLNAVNTIASTGSTSSPSSGSVITTNANDLLIAAVTINSSTAISAWSNSFTSEADFTNGGSKNSQSHYGGADNVVGAVGTYSTVATAGASAAWRGQIAAFKTAPPVLSADIVNGSGVSVSSPSATMTNSTYSFSCQTVTGTLGTSSQKIRVNNTTTNPAWTLSIAATGGQTATWSSGAASYAFNNPSGSGCTAGQMTVDPSVATNTPQSGCTTTGVSLGSSNAFSSGVLNSIALASASTSAAYNCYWDITGIALSQKIPAEQKVGSYTLNLTLTLVAN